MAIPANPRNLVASFEVDNDLVRLNFTPGAGSTSTRIDRWDSVTQLYETVGTVGPGIGTYIDTDLTDGMRYAYRGLGINDDGSPATFSARSNFVDILATPDPVTDITAARNSNNSIGVNWENNNTTLRPYTLHYILRTSSTQTSWAQAKSQINRISGSLAYYLDSRTELDHWYRYRVWTANDLGGAYYMSSITAPVWTAPLAPTNVRARWDGNDIILSWTNPSVTAVQFTIEHMGEGAGQWDPMGTVGKRTSWRMSNAERGIDHRFRISAQTPVNPDGNRVSSPFVMSPWLAAQTTPNPPTITGPGFAAASSTFTATYIYNPLSPDSPEGAVKHQRRASAGGTWSAEVMGADVTAYGSGTMEIRMASRTTESGWSDWSDPFPIAIRSRPPLTVNSPTAGSVLNGPVLPLAWTANTQVQWEAEVLQGSTLIHTGTGITEKAWNPSLEDGLSYTARLRVHDGYLWSNWVTRSFTTSFETPASVAMVAVTDPDRAGVELQVSMPDNIAPNPSFEEVGAPVEVWRNYATSPRGITTAGSYSAAPDSTTVDVPLPTPTPLGTTTGVEVVCSAQFAGIRFNRSVVPVPPGTWELSCYAMRVSGADVRVGMAVSGIGSTGNQYMPLNEWVRFSWVVSPESEITASMGWRTGEATPEGETATYLISDMSIAAPGAEVFDGDHSPDPDLTPSWTGTPNASASILSYTPVAGVGGWSSTDWAASGERSLRVPTVEEIAGPPALSVSENTGNLPLAGVGTVVAVGAGSPAANNQRLFASGGDFGGYTIVSLTTGGVFGFTRSGDQPAASEMGRIGSNLYWCYIMGPIPGDNYGIGDTRNGGSPTFQWTTGPVAGAVYEHGLSAEQAMAVAGALSARLGFATLTAGQTFSIVARNPGQEVFLDGVLHHTTARSGETVWVTGPGNVGLGEGWWDNQLVVNDPTYDGPWVAPGPKPSRVEILRRASGTSEWKNLGPIVDGKLWDGLPPLRTDLEYAALGITESGAQSLSALVDVFIDEQSYVINYGPGLGQVIKLECDLQAAAELLGAEVELYLFAGRNWPSEVRGPGRSRRVEAIGKPVGWDNLQQFNREWINVLESEQKWFRDLSGLSFRASIGEIANARGYYGSEVTFTAEQIGEEE